MKDIHEKKAIRKPGENPGSLSSAGASPAPAFSANRADVYGKRSSLLPKA
jgi:hypothetical protein